MAYPVTYTWAAASVAYVSALQTAAGSGALLINGSGADALSAGATSSRVWLRGSGFERTISITSTGNLSGVNFTIVGEDIRGNAVTETRVGPNNNTVYTTAYFYKVTSVSVDAAVGTAVSLGIGTTGQSQWYKVNYQLTPVNIGLGVTVTAGTINWTVRQTTYNVETAEPPSTAIIDHSDTNMVSQTVSRQGNYVIPFGATRLVVNSSTNGALVFNIYQAGIV